jgi:5-methyltetrahydropteroyltriglutamate--homocysteine methyltransferase
MPSANRILTTHVGSLIRPPELLALLERKRDGGNDDATAETAIEAAKVKAVQEVVRHQAEIGIDIINDGEFGKNLSWSRYILERLSGFEPRPNEPQHVFARATYGKDRRDFADFYAEYDPSQRMVGISNWAVTGPIAYKGEAALVADLRRFKEALKGVNVTDAFCPAVAPSSVAIDRKDEYYKSDQDYVVALGEALRHEYRAIIDAGFILQIDDAYIATYYDVIVPPGSMEDYRKWVGFRIEVLNHAIAGLPEDRMRYHVCWGSWNGPHVSDVPFSAIADLVLKLKVGAWSLEMANPRHEHEWRVWERVKLPAGKKLLPGLVSHATNIVEHPELVAERIVRLAQLVGPDNVIASTDCGFAQGTFTRRTHPSIQWAKLAALVEGARLATQQLF